MLPMVGEAACTATSGVGATSGLWQPAKNHPAHNKAAKAGRLAVMRRLDFNARRFSIMPSLRFSEILAGEQLQVCQGGLVAHDAVFPGVLLRGERRLRIH